MWVPRCICSCLMCAPPGAALSAGRPAWAASEIARAKGEQLLKHSAVLNSIVRSSMANFHHSWQLVQPSTREEDEDESHRAPHAQLTQGLRALQLGSQQGTTAAQLRAAKASFEAEYRRLPSPQWQLMGEFARVYDSVLEGFQERQRREEASQAAAAAAEADRRAEQVRLHSECRLESCVRAGLCFVGAMQLQNQLRPAAEPSRCGPTLEQLVAVAGPLC